MGPDLVEGLLKVAAKRLFDVDAVAAQAGKVDPTPHCKQYAKKLRQELPHQGPEIV